MTKILVVEDEQMLRDVYTTLFNLEKYDVMGAANGQEALRLLKKFQPDIVLLDVLMPVMNGIEFLEKVRPKENYPELKVLVLSNLSDSKTLKDILRLGATKYLLKASLSPAELIKAVHELNA